MRPNGVVIGLGVLGLLLVVALMVCSPSAPATASVPEGPRLITLMPTTGVISGASTAEGQWVTDLQNYDSALVMLYVTDKTMDASTTLDFYVQYSPDAGTTVDDIAHFAQVTDSAVTTGTYVLYLHRGPDGEKDRIVDDGETISANSVRDISWADRLRIKTVAAEFGADDVLTYSVRAYMQ